MSLRHQQYLGRCSGSRVYHRGMLYERQTCRIRKRNKLTGVRDRFVALSRGYLYRFNSENDMSMRCAETVEIVDGQYLVHQ